jgi:hypothetical protein
MRYADRGMDHAGTINFLSKIGMGDTNKAILHIMSNKPRKGC